jgi:hypothetical protein
MGVTKSSRNSGSLGCKRVYFVVAVMPSRLPGEVCRYRAQNVTHRVQPLILFNIFLTQSHGGLTLLTAQSQVAWSIHAAMQDTNDCNSVVRNTKVNHVLLNTSATIARPDVVTGRS